MGPMDPKIGIFLMNFVFPVVVVPLAIPMARRKIPPNPFYGFRTPKTFSSEAIWYEANAYSGKALCIAGVVSLAGLLALLPFCRLLSLWPFLILGWIVTGVPLVTAVVMSFVRLARL